MGAMVDPGKGGFPRIGEYAFLSDCHTGALVAPETGTYRLALTGVKGQIDIAGGSPVTATAYSRWAEPLKLTEVQLVKGLIGTRQDHRATVRGLGLRRVNSVSELQDTPSVRGMINKVSYLVKVVA